MGGHFYDNYSRNLELDRLKIAAFELHQATESLCTAYLLVQTGYALKTHNLNKLRALVEDQDPRFRDVWPPGARGGRRAFERLKDAYVKARYSRHYQIEREELLWLGQRVAVLRDLVKTLCEERIAALRTEAERTG